MSHFGLEYTLDVEQKDSMQKVQNFIGLLIVDMLDFKSVRETHLGMLGDVYSDIHSIDSVKESLLYGRIEFYNVEGPEKITTEIFFPTRYSEFRDVRGRFYVDNYEPAQIFKSKSRGSDTYGELLRHLQEGIVARGAKDLHELRLYDKDKTNIIQFPRRET